MAIHKLSDVNPIHAFLMNGKNINNYVFNPKVSEINLNEQYDIGLVLGCKNYNIMKCRIDETIKLYNSQTIKKIILSGGAGFFSKNKEESEAYVMYKYLLNNGISNNDITIENKSKNTLENMKNIIKYIESNKLYKKIVIITSDFHSKRSKGMLKKLTDLDIYSHGVLDGIHDIEVWNKGNISIKTLIRLEALLLSWYTKKEIIEDQKVFIKTR